MDNLKSLMDKKQYELVIRLTQNSNDTNSIFYCISALVASNKLDEALDIIKNKRNILVSRLALLIKIHIEVLCLMERFDEAYEELKYYENLPYESQEVEEMLRSAPSLIRIEEKKSLQNKSFSQDELIASLKSDDSDNVLLGLDMLREREIAPYIPYVKNILVNFPRQTIRSFALLLLVGKEYSKEIKFNSLGAEISLVPNKLKPPFVGEEFNLFLREIDKEFSNPSFAETLTQILSTYVLYTYPANILEDKEALKEALIVVTKKYMAMALNEKDNNPSEEAKKYIKEIDDALAD